MSHAGGRPKGLPKTGGRQKGSRNRAILEREQAIERTYASVCSALAVQPDRLTQVTPLEAMLLCMQWSLQAKDRTGILAAASAAAPYVHAKLSSTDLRVKHDYAELDDEQLRTAAAALELKLAALNHATIGGEVAH